MFEWDEVKNKTNREKHGINFEDAKEIFQGFVLENTSPQTDHNKERIVAVGLLYKKYYITVVFTWRNKNRRLISARKARKNEKEHYQNEIRRRSGQESN